MFWSILLKILSSVLSSWWLVKVCVGLVEDFGFSQGFCQFVCFIGELLDGVFDYGGCVVVVQCGDQLLMIVYCVCVLLWVGCEYLCLYSVWY